MKKPQRSYALCLGTLPKDKAYEIADLLRNAPSCNCEIRLRGRGARPTGYKDYLPLDRATHAAIYVSIKRSLHKKIKAAEVRDKILEATGQL